MTLVLILPGVTAAGVLIMCLLCVFHVPGFRHRSVKKMVHASRPGSSTRAPIVRNGDLVSTSPMRWGGPAEVIGAEPDDPDDDL